MLVTARALTVSEKVRLTAEIAAAYVTVRRTMFRRQLPQVLESLRGRYARPPRRVPVSAGNPWPVAHALRRLMAPLPTDSPCLIQSLVLLSLLERRGIHTDLVIGARPGPTFGAHAWVEQDGEAYLPTGGSEFERLVAL